jgi:hypothetical protein
MEICGAAIVKFTSVEDDIDPLALLTRAAPRPPNPRAIGVGPRPRCLSCHHCCQALDTNEGIPNRGSLRKRVAIRDRGGPT